MDIVTLSEDAGENPLALLIADLIGQNVNRHAAREESILDLTLTVHLTATDLDSSVLLDFRGSEGLIVTNTGLPLPGARPLVYVEATSDAILDLARVPVHGKRGLPRLRTPEGKLLVNHIRGGRVIIKPALRYARRLLRLLFIISVA